MPPKNSSYQELYIKKDGEFINLRDDVTAFCEKYIKKVHPENWDWGKRDFTLKKNKPTIAEARAIRDVIYKDMDAKTATEVDISTLMNIESVKAFFDPKSKNEEFNMEEFAYALDVELEHGKIRSANVTGNHPFLTAVVVLAHMTETVTYYKRLQVMEKEGEIYELTRKLDHIKTDKDKYYKQLARAEKELWDIKKELTDRFDKMNDIPVVEEFE